ncbi:MAG: S46 family peptidase [Alphaproteobacteria bacterium]|nr:S46 family peptidase [Alphaproteobacteria bacterium]
MLLVVAGAFASEGMWLPGQLADRGPWLEQSGIEVPAAELSDPSKLPLAAIVSVGGFCSGSFVSADGLVMTNRHCVDSFLQATSSEADDRVTNGFLARSRAEEAPGGPEAVLYLLESVTDVTGKVRSVIEDGKVADQDRLAAVERASSALVSACERGGAHCEVVPQYGGARWQLLKSRELRDVRVVYAPSTQVAYFGGDADNFEWPRHDGDFAILRAYVAPNGKTAEPSPKNVPYRPKAWLPIDGGGAQPDEPVMVAGFPGGTERFEIPERIAYAAQQELPSELAWMRKLLELAASTTADSEEGRTKLASEVLDLENGRKYVEGMIDGVRASPVLERKQAQLDAFLAAQPEAATPSPAGRALAVLRRLETQRQGDAAQSRLLERLMSSDLLSLAWEGLRWSEEHARPDREREPGYQDRDRDDTVSWLVATTDTLFLPYDRAVLTEALAGYEAAPRDLHVKALDALIEEAGGRDALLDRLYAAPTMADPVNAQALMRQKPAVLEASTDPWVRLAVALEHGALADLRARSRARQGEALRVRGDWELGLMASIGPDAYPDANNTLRVTVGRVMGYAPRDGLVATPITTVRGLVAKDRLPLYTAPPELLEWAAQEPDPDLVEASVGDVPIAFLSDVDTTGGNSGSATLDGKGALVGLIFDGNYESMTADWLYDPALTRSVHVDIRYVQWLMRHQPDAAWILGELGLSR